MVEAVAASAPTEGYDSAVPRGSLWQSLLLNMLPLVLVLGLLWFLMSSMQGGGNKIMQFGRSKATLTSPDTPKVKFDDVAGCDEAVEELKEIQEFLENPAKFQAVGAKIPKGVLLYGPPGTGKTLLGARRRGRGRRAVLLDLRFRLRRDVRRRGREPRARPLRAGQEGKPRHHLRRRDRRGRPPPWRGHGRRSRRARADPQPDAGRDGRLRRHHQRHHDRGDQPPRHPRPRAAAPRSLRPPDRRRRPRLQGQAEGARGSRQGQAHVARRQPHRDRQAHARLHRRRPRERAQRGRAAHGAQGPHA